MVQTNLSSDNFCGFNQSAAPFYYTMDPVQNTVAFKTGEVGVFPSVGVHTPGNVIKVDSYLKDIGNVLTKCNLPVPSKNIDKLNKDNCEEKEEKESVDNKESVDEQELDLINYMRKFNDEHMNELAEQKETFGNYMYKNYNKFEEVQNKNIFLLPNYTREKGCAKDLSAVDLQGGFGGNVGNLFSDPQNLNHIIESGIALERGGLVSNQLIKESYKFKSPSIGNNVKTGCKIKTPYPTFAPFGLKFDQKSEHFNANDVVSIGVSSPDYGQKEGHIYNDEAPYINGGCNPVSMVKIDKVCNDNTTM